MPAAGTTTVFTPRDAGCWEVSSLDFRIKIYFTSVWPDYRFRLVRRLPHLHTKQTIREAHTTFRRHLASKPDEKRQRDASILQHTLEALDHFGAVGSEISAYHPLRTEPAAADYPLQLAQHARTVWLPISLPGGVLQWAACTEEQQPGALGIAEPVGSRFSSEVLKGCAALVIPALAVDRRGQRLGKGAGYYDRALEQVRDHRIPIVAVVFDEEVVDTLPAQPHDVPVDAIVTDRGFFPL